jgi:AraC-like DNA-binding protein
MVMQRFNTRDVEEARAVVARLAPGMVVHPLGRDFEIGVEAVTLPRVVVFRMRARQTLLRGVRRGFAGGTMLVQGSVQITDGQGEDWYGPEVAHFVPVSDEIFEVRSPEAVLGFGFAILPELMAATSERLGIDAAAGTRRIPLLSEPGSALRRGVQFIWRECGCSRHYDRSPAAAHTLEEFLAVSLLLAGQPEAADGAPIGPVRRVERYLDENLEQRITVNDVVVACGIPRHSLFREFRRRHGMGPMGYLRQRRIEAAQGALIVGDSKSTSVTEVAGRFRFPHLGRFAAAYRREFGELPSETLGEC